MTCSILTCALNFIILHYMSLCHLCRNCKIIVYKRLNECVSSLRLKIKVLCTCSSIFVIYHVLLSLYPTHHVQQYQNHHHFMLMTQSLVIHYWLYLWTWEMTLECYWDSMRVNMCHCAMSFMERQMRTSTLSVMCVSLSMPTTQGSEVMWTLMWWIGLASELWTVLISVKTLGLMLMVAEVLWMVWR